MVPTALPGGAQQDLGDRRLETRVVVADHDRDAVQAARAERAQELTPGGLVLGVAEGQAQNLTVAAGADPGRDHDGPRDHAPATRALT